MFSFLHTAVAQRFQTLIMKTKRAVTSEPHWKQNEICWLHELAKCFNCFFNGSQCNHFEIHPFNMLQISKFWNYSWNQKKKLDTLNALTYTNFSQAERENGSNIIWREDKSISVLIMATNSLVFFLQMTLKTLKWRINTITPSNANYEILKITSWQLKNYNWYQFLTSAYFMV